MDDGGAGVTHRFFALQHAASWKRSFISQVTTHRSQPRPWLKQPRVGDGHVKFALKYPHTFYVLAFLMLFLGGSSILVTPKDIFPNINIPVVSIIWQYTGLTPEEMEQRVTTYSEYSISSSVNDIKNIESQTLSGISVERIYFQPNVNVDLAIAQIVSASNSIRALMPYRHPAADHRAIQCVVRAGDPAQPEFGQAERTAALRLRHLPGAPATGADPGHHPAHALWRQIPPDHGGSRSRRAAGAGPDTERRRDGGERAEPDAAVGRCEDGQPAIHRPGECHGAIDQGAERRADQAGGRHHGLSARRGACARRLGGAAERGARGRQASPCC